MSRIKGQLRKSRLKIDNPNIKEIKNAAQFLLNSGLLFEMNKKILHPLGLAMAANNSGECFNFYLLDCREDPEGFLFDEPTFEYGKNKLDEYMRNHGSKSLQDREKELGFIEQYIGKK